MKAKIGSNYLERKTGEILCVCGFVSSSRTNEVHPNRMMEVMVYRGKIGERELYLVSIKVHQWGVSSPIIAHEMVGDWIEISNDINEVKKLTYE